MEVSDRLDAMLRHADLQAFEVGEVHTYGTCADGRTRRSSFALTRAGARYAEVSLEVHGDAATGLAQVIGALLRGSEGRLLDAEQSRREIAELQRKLSDYDKGGIEARGPFYAADHGTGGVWLVGRPADDAFGFNFKNWADLAEALPGLRPCGVEAGRGGPYIIMRPIAVLQEVR